MDAYLGDTDHLDSNQGAAVWPEKEVMDTDGPAVLTVPGQVN